MRRREFVCRVITAGAAGANLARPAEAKENRGVTYRVKGFTCVTCAVGLTIAASPKCCSKGRQPKLLPPLTSRYCLRPPASRQTRAPMAERLLGPKSKPT